MPVFEKPFRLCKSLWMTGCIICIAHTSKLIPSWVSSGTCKLRGHLRMNIPLLPFKSHSCPTPATFLLSHLCILRISLWPSSSLFLTGPEIPYSSFLANAIYSWLSITNFLDLHILKPSANFTCI